MSGRAALAFGAALVAMLCAGLWIGGHPAKMPPSLRDVFVDDSAGLTAEASELIEDHYYREVDEANLANGSLRGMVRDLRLRHHDRFSEYFSPKMLEYFNEALSGRFSGIGLTVTPVPRGLHAAQVFPKSPAKRAGIEPGDVIVSVDGESLAGQNSEIATGKIKGPEGTDVVLGVLDGDTGKVRRLTLTREEITVPVVTGRVMKADGRKLGYVRLATFSEGAHAAVRHAVEKVEKKGAEGVLLDLRGNGGGLLEEAVLTASVFLPKDELVVTTRSRTEGNSAYRTVGGNLPERPVAVLIDRNTASAAEILTAALADDAKAPVVGTRSYGKGVFQQEVGLSNGGALKLTTGEYFTPKGVNLAGKGIQPDIHVRDLPDTPMDEALERALGVLAAQPPA
ncbi:MAG TPA: S41 family peptidase [Solirubrobacterales bacterium]|nr:S41 family peptidase [Solirubrobacterales bacterium]